MKAILFLLLIASQLLSFAQKFEANYDEAKMPAYSLPDPLKFNDGSQIVGKKDWTRRRSELYKIFETEVFGVTPDWKGALEVTKLSLKEDALNGLAKRKEVRLEFKKGEQKVAITVLIYLPKKSKKGPLFVGYNFDGNHTTTTEADVLKPDSWVANNKELGITDHRANEAGRGKSSSGWPLKEILKRGFGVATAYYGDVDPDFNDGFKDGIHPLLDTKRDSTSWGSIAAWSWGLSRIMDYLTNDKDVNAKKIIVIGHSRLGKASLWAGASDPRFAMVIANNSGCGGAALSKRIYGETVGSINSAFPHWFCDNFKKYNRREDLLPIDQHELLALIAPRPVYIASAQDDKWADPKGEFLSCVYASPVYEFLGGKNFPAMEMPPLNTPAIGDISYHIRPGKHDITLYDWNCYMDFASSYFRVKTN